jgi:hypothetical protein
MTGPTAIFWNCPAVKATMTVLPVTLRVHRLMADWTFFANPSNVAAKEATVIHENL